VRRKAIAASLFGLSIFAFVYYLSYEPGLPLERKGSGSGVLGGLDVNQVLSLLTALASLAGAVMTFLTSRRKP